MGACNVKVIQYPNGTTQVRKYSSPMLTKQAPCVEEELSFMDEQKILKGGCIYKNGVQYCLSPFDNSIVKQVVEFETKPLKKESSESDLWHSANRAKSKIYEYARCVAWEYFVTFTFSPEKVDRYDYAECSRIVRRWLNNQRVNAPDLFYLVVPEQHKDGAWHFHGLLANVGNMKFSDSGKKTKKGHVIFNMSKWSYGFTTATAIQDVCKVANYVGKYITKDLCKATVGKQRYFVSKNMPAPQVSTFLVDGYRELDEVEESQYWKLSEEDKQAFLKDLFKKQELTNFNDFLVCLADSLGQDVVHISTPRHDGAFVDVDYYELMEKKDNTE